MFCTGCRHNLQGTEVNVCPECGRTFNPDDPASFLKNRSKLSSNPPNRIGRVGWLAVACALAPWISIAAIVVLWGMAWFQLGHPPTPSIDDPKAIGGPFFAWTHDTTILLLILLIPETGLAFLLLGIQTGRALLDARRKRSWLVMTTVSLGSLSSAWLILKTAWIQEIITWIFD